MRGFFVAFVLLTLPVSIPIAILTWPLIIVEIIPDALRTTSAAQWSDDKAFKASIIAIQHPTLWIIPADVDYSVRVEAMPGFHPGKTRYDTDNGWDLTLPIDVDAAYQKLVELRWESSRLLRIAVKTETLQGSLTRKNQDLTIQIDYRPDLTTKAAIQ